MEVFPERDGNCLFPSLLLAPAEVRMEVFPERDGNNWNMMTRPLVEALVRMEVFPERDGNGSVGYNADGNPYCRPNGGLP